MQKENKEEVRWMHPTPWSIDHIKGDEDYCNIYDANNNYVCTINDYRLASYIVEQINDHD